MTTTDSTPGTTYAHGTVIHVQPSCLPFNSPDSKKADPVERTVVDPSHYLQHGSEIATPQEARAILVLEPNGWEATVKPGRQDEGMTAHLWWVEPSYVMAAPEGPTQPDSDAQFRAAVEQREALAGELDRVKAQLAEALSGQEVWRDRYQATHREFQQFRKDVRDKAIEVQEAQGWCDDGLNEVLSDLGLEPKVVEWEVEVTITATQTVTVRVTAADEDDAKEKITEGEVELEPDRYGWEWQTADDLDFESVEKA